MRLSSLRITRAEASATGRIGRPWRSAHSRLRARARPAIARSPASPFASSTPPRTCPPASAAPRTPWGAPASTPTRAASTDREGTPGQRPLPGEPVRELYTAEDLPAGVGGPEDPVGRPGEYPYTRGIHSSMYRGRLWTMRQFAGFGTSEET